MIHIDMNEKKYDKVIFSNTSIDINYGSFIGIKGESGAGKSTLLGIIGLLEDFDGNYYIDDLNVSDKEKVRCDNFAYVFQKPYLIPYLNVLDNLLMPLRNLKEDRNDYFINEVVELLDIKDLLNRKIHNLSGGEALRVSIGRAILSNRKIILADEPTGSLDPKNSKNIMELFKKLNEKYNITVVMVTHSQSYDEYFDEIWDIKERKVVKL